MGSEIDKDLAGLALSSASDDGKTDTATGGVRDDVLEDDLAIGSTSDDTLAELVTGSTSDDTLAELVTGSTSDDTLAELVTGSTSDDNVAELASGSTSDGSVTIKASGDTHARSYNLVQRGIDDAVTAVELDKKHDYPAALRHYERCLEYFIQAIKYEAHSEKAKEAIRTKSEQYLNRADKIKAYLDKKQKKTATPAISRQDSYEEDEEEDEAFTAIMGEKPCIRCEDVVDISGVKKALQQEVLIPIKFPHLFSGSRKAVSGLILFGVPGCGKSYLVRSICSLSNASYIYRSCSDFMTNYVSTKTKIKTIQKMFHVARENKPSIVFLDDIDLLESEDEVKRTVWNELHVQHGEVVFLTTTSVPWKLNMYWWRVLQKRFYVPLPTAAERSSLFRIHLGSSNHSLIDEDFTEIGDQCEGYTPADVSVAARESLMAPVRTVQQATHYKKVSGPSPTDATVTVFDLLTPCSPGDEGAIEMDWTQISSDKLLEPPVTKADVLKAIAGIKCSMSDEEVRKIEGFRDTEINTNSTEPYQ